MNYTEKKVSYSSGDMFTLTGSDFYGYVEYSNGKVKTYDTQLELTPKSTYKTSLFTSELFFDRVIGDEDISLPKTLDDCLFSFNDTFSYESFKSKLDSIYYNINFIYSQLFIPTNKLPSSTDITYFCLTGAVDTNFTSQTVNISSPVILQSTPFGSSDTFASLAGIVNATAQSYYDDESKYVWFTATSSHFISMSGSSTDIKIIEQSQYIESEENEITFGEIGDIVSNDKFLFISSRTDNVIYKYDIAGYLNNDTVLSNKRNLIEVMGGTGTSANKFDNVSKLACNDEIIAAYNVRGRGRQEIKLYDINFNYITKLHGIKETIYAMGFDPIFNNLYVIASANDVVYLYRYDECFSSFEKIELEERMINGEIPLKVDFSRSDSNFWYLITQRRVFKKLKTRPAPFIGVFKSKNIYNQTLIWAPSAAPENNYWNNIEATFTGATFNYNNIFLAANGCQEDALENGIFDNIFKGFCIFSSTGNTDRIVMLTNSRLYFFYEPNKFESVLKQDNYPFYGSEGITLDPEEYIQTSSINSELYKVVYDSLTLKNNIVGRFSGKTENDYLILDKYNYNLDFSDFIDSVDQEFYIQSNEKNVVGVVNRSLRKIYDLQVKLVNLIAADIDKTPQKQYTSTSTIQI